MSSLNLNKILVRKNWNIEKIKFFLTTKPYDSDDNLRELNWPKNFILNIEKTPQFSSFDGLTFIEMKQHIYDCDELFSKKTYEVIKEIESNPHTYNITDTDFKNDKCIIMVDASYKQNGKESFSGIAGCIRNSNGSVISGFAKEIDTINNHNTTTLELIAILEGMEVAEIYGMKNYTIVSDCIGNASKIHNMTLGIVSMGQDYQDNMETYTKILHYLEKHNAEIAYIPRVFNNIADEYSKTYQKRVSNLFNKNKEEILSISKQVLRDKKNQKDYDGEIYFHHEKNKIYIDSSPYEMDKNYHLNFTYNPEKNDNDYDIYILPFYFPASKSFMNYQIDLKTREFKLLSERKVENNKSMILQSIDNLGYILSSCADKKVALFTEHGLVAKNNRLSPINDAEIKHYQKIYHHFDSLKEVSFFLKDNKIYNSILSNLNKERTAEHYKNNKKQVMKK